MKPTVSLATCSVLTLTLALLVPAPLSAQCALNLSGPWQVFGATFCGVPFLATVDFSQTGCRVTFTVTGLGDVEGTIDETSGEVDLTVTLPASCDGTVPGIMTPGEEGGFDLLYGSGIACCRNGFGAVVPVTAPPGPPPPGNENPGVVRWIADTLEGREGGVMVEMELERLDGTDGVVAVEVSTVEERGTATPGVDYEALREIVTWGNGEGGARVVSLPVIDDDLDEGSETAVAVVSASAGGVRVEGSGITRVVIHDDDDSTTCTTDAATQLCLSGEDRFKVQAAWRSQQGERGEGLAVALPLADSGLFTFFDPDNAELLVKVLDACDFVDRFWVFFGGTTNQEFTLTVTDTRADETRVYHHDLGALVSPVADTAAFATCP